MKKSKLLMSCAVAGLLLGAQTALAQDPEVQTTEEGKNGCKGNNACKGKVKPASKKEEAKKEGAHSCAGANACSGPNGCDGKAEAPATAPTNP
jgi:hypothetical protein